MSKLGKRVIFTALLAALVAALTFVHLPVPIPQLNGGYVHVGDSLIYLAACLLPAPWAMLAAALGGSLADLLSGAPLWVPATLVIKACMALCFSAKQETLLRPRNVLALLPATAINLVGYYFAELLMFGGDWRALLAPSLIGGAVQSGGSAVLFLALAAALERAGLKKRMQRWL
jgi:uncharacterized repeat protein (TIGR04002 family)